MESVYKNFYRNFYKKTNGFIPVSPLGKSMYPGDFFQIRNGQMIVLGNIYRNHVVEPEEVEIGYGIKLNPAEWNCYDGVTKPYAGRGSGLGPVGGEFEFSKQILAFAEKGGFIFKVNDPESIRILNWNNIHQALIIRLTQTYYSFREVYLVTESVTAADWTLAVSGAAQAELELATNAENFGLVDLFGHQSSRTIQSKDIEYYNREEKRKPFFFKAKKLTVREEKMEIFISSLIEQWHEQKEWVRMFYKYDFHYETQYDAVLGGYSEGNILDLLPPYELNPNTALLYFKWTDANLDDVEKLFIDYGQ